MKNQSKTKLGIQIGVFVPLSTYYYLKLFSKARGITLHKIVSQAIDAVRETSLFPSVEDLRTDMVSRIKQQWAIEIGQRGIISKEEQNDVRRAVIAEYEKKMNRLDKADREAIIKEARKSISTGTQTTLWPKTI